LRPDNKPRCPTSALLVIVMPPDAFPLVGSGSLKVIQIQMLKNTWHVSDLCTLFVGETQTLVSLSGWQDNMLTTLWNKTVGWKGKSVPEHICVGYPPFYKAIVSILKQLGKIRIRYFFIDSWIKIVTGVTYNKRSTGWFSAHCVWRHPGRNIRRGVGFPAEILHCLRPLVFFFGYGYEMTNVSGSKE
jgi:hypothetical protein